MVICLRLKSFLKLTELSLQVTGRHIGKTFTWRNDTRTACWSAFGQDTETVAAPGMAVNRADSGDILCLIQTYPHCHVMQISSICLPKTSLPKTSDNDHRSLNMKETNRITSVTFSYHTLKKATPLLTVTVCNFHFHWIMMKLLLHLLYTPGTFGDWVVLLRTTSI